MKQIQMIIKFLPIILFLAISCAPPKIDKELQPFVDSFSNYATYYNVEINLDYDIVFVPSIVGATVGQCNWEGIIIDKSYWDKIGFYDKEQLLFHELGHCSLGLDHIPTFGIMYKSMLMDYYYRRDRERLIKELFESAK